MRRNPSEPVGTRRKTNSYVGKPILTSDSVGGRFSRKTSTKKRKFLPTPTRLFPGFGFEMLRGIGRRRCFPNMKAQGRKQNRYTGRTNYVYNSFPMKSDVRIGLYKNWFPDAKIVFQRNPRKSKEIRHGFWCWRCDVRSDCIEGWRNPKTRKQLSETNRKPKTLEAENKPEQP